MGDMSITPEQRELAMKTMLEIIGDLRLPEPGSVPGNNVNSSSSLYPPPADDQFVSLLNRMAGMKTNHYDDEEVGL